MRLIYSWIQSLHFNALLSLLDYSPHLFLFHLNNPHWFEFDIILPLYICFLKKILHFCLCHQRDIEICISKIYLKKEENKIDAMYRWSKVDKTIISGVYFICLQSTCSGIFNGSNLFLCNLFHFLKRVCHVLAPYCCIRCMPFSAEDEATLSYSNLLLPFIVSNSIEFVDLMLSTILQTNMKMPSITFNIQAGGQTSNIHCSSHYIMLLVSVTLEVKST